MSNTRLISLPRYQHGAGEWTADREVTCCHGEAGEQMPGRSPFRKSDRPGMELRTKVLLSAQGARGLGFHPNTTEKGGWGELFNTDLFSESRILKFSNSVC